MLRSHGGLFTLLCALVIGCSDSADPSPSETQNTPVITQAPGTATAAPTDRPETEAPATDVPATELPETPEPTDIPTTPTASATQPPATNSQAPSETEAPSATPSAEASASQELTATPGQVGRDRDGDGYVSGEDCDDTDAEINPGAAEVCDGIDNDCDGLIDDQDDNVSEVPTWYIDLDSDGYGSADIYFLQCQQPTGFVDNDDDCDDQNAAVNPDTLWHLDLDNDGYGTDAATFQQCSPPTGFATEGGDCDDANDEVSPGAEEQCNGIDDNCNGTIDIDTPPSSWYRDLDDDNYGDSSVVNEVGGCDVPRSSQVGGDCNDANAEINPGAVELCDDVDNDCDVEIDEDFDDECNPLDDQDGDGYTLEEGDCEDQNADINPGAEEVCDDVDNDCDEAVDEGLECAPDPNDHDGDGYTVEEGDCNDIDADTYPGAEELCDLRDNDCDGVADDGLEDCTLDPNGDYDDDGYTLEEGDCDDLDPTTHPGAEEVCDLWDNDCDGETNEGLEDCIFDPEGDYDGDGTTIDDGDCDDADPSTYPGAEEVCDFQDNNCNGQIDEQEGDACEYGPDGDFDDDGVSVEEGDCNDLDEDIYPGAEEVCDLQDNNCDGLADEDLNCDDVPDVSSEDHDGDGYSVEDGDCDDKDASTYPDAEEICDGRDNNCDGVADEGLEDCDYPSSEDQDGDGYSVDDGDCDDQDPENYPGADEVCDLEDNDCDGQADEDLSVYCDDVGENEPDRDNDGWTVTAGDCDDLDSSTHPDALEQCDRQDNDCDLEVDEGLEESCDEDLDQDEDNDGYSPNEGDCDDTDDTISPQAGEICDLQDNDCDSEVDEDLGDTCPYNDGTEDDRDEDGYTIEGGDCDDLDAGTNPGAIEVCDLQDNNCDGVADEGLDCPDENGGSDVDNDGDGYSVDEGDCDDTDPATHPDAQEQCDLDDNNCDGQADEGLEDCDYTDVSPVDQDDDGYTLSEGDCDDLDSTTYPGAEEVCDLADNDCDALADENLEGCDLASDQDNDGDGFSVDEGDCDDTDPDSYPGADEVCDAQDNNCDGQADEGLEAECGYPIDYDRDDDAWTVQEGDCNDLDSSIYPGAVEQCDLKDNDCDGLADEGLEDSCELDGSVDHDGDGWSSDAGDCNDTDADSYPGAEELCDGTDNDCDAVADEGFEDDCPDDGAADLDDDGFTIGEGDCNDFDANQSPDGTESCDGLDNDCDGVADEGLDGCDTSSDEDDDGVTVADGDCDDHDPNTYPGANETCDGADNNCDGIADEGLTYCGYSEDFDEDDDGYTQLEGDCNDADSSVNPGADEQCDLEDDDCDGDVDEDVEPCDTDPTVDHDGDGYTIDDGDCDDGDVSTHPDADEECDDRDNDCDGFVDEGLPSDCELPSVDLDGDGYTVGEGDCNDTNGSIHPNAPEYCDGIDNNCDLSVDEGLEDCDTGPNDVDEDDHTVDGGDCNDQDDSIYPEAPESCDLKDNDCDGTVDEGLGEACEPVFDEDLDQDGFTQLEGDCDDLDSGVYPGAEELCDAQDNNCNGTVDEGVEPCDTNGNDDHDGDDYTIDDGDCDDHDPTVHPDSEDVCDDRDNDCDGLTDEDEGPCDDVHDGEVDIDGDGYTVGEGDCNDFDANQNPAAEEVCDGRDNDCDGTADDLEECVGDIDADEDGYTIDEGDCNDLDPAANPGAEEVCDFIDNNCDGTADGGLEGCNDAPDTDTDEDGYTVGEGDCNDLDPSVNPGAEEVCDLKDNNCDGDVDEGLDDECAYNTGFDYDDDGFSVQEGDCNDADPTINPDAEDGCDFKDNDCDGDVDEDVENCVYVEIGDQDEDGYSIVHGDCLDTDDTVYPGAEEVCDYKDNDCDGALDEGLGTDCDYDGDGYTESTGDCDESNADTYPGAEEKCDLEDNDCDNLSDEGVANSCDYDEDGYPISEGDCNDVNDEFFPGAEELCDLRDNDCDNEVDEQVEEGCDYDEDGYSSEDGDCDNYNDAIYPGATDICDLLDNDCDEIIDEDYAAVCNGTDDFDNDGYTTEEGDCNDFNEDAYPGGTEVCDLADNDCDDLIDEGYATGCATTADLDEDGYTVVEGDCNDLDEEVYPDAEELCDRKNNDCDLAIDEGCDDFDDDYDDDGYSVEDGDCNDSDPNTYPGALELCDFRDNDCDGTVGDLDDNDGDGFVPCTGDCNDTDDDLYPSADEEWYDGVDSDCDGDENPPACSEEPPIIPVEVISNCTVDLELTILDVCDGDCDTDFLAVIELRNHGSTASPDGVPLSLYGISDDGFYTPLDTFTVASVPSGFSSGAISVDLGTFSALYRYASFALAVDDDGSGGEMLQECDESNNLDLQHVLALDCPLPDPCTLEPPGHPVPPNFECTYTPTVGSFTPVLEWQRQSFATGSSYKQIMAAPAIGNLTDDNGDGRIDERDVPDIVFSTFSGSGYGSTGYLRAISGDDGRELFATYGVTGAAGVALGDTDADGVPEVYSVNTSGHLMRFNNLGQHQWTCASTSYRYNNPAIADIDGDGQAEILSGRSVCNNQGQVLFTTTLSHDSVSSFLLDVDQDGLMEVVSGSGVSNIDGSTRWTGPGGYAAMADFDNDGRPELVSVNKGQHTIYLYDDNGAYLWSSSIPGGKGGPPTVADYDGDGQPEIGVAGFDFYTVFDGDGSIIWSNPVRDHSSSVTGSSVYDFDGDGAAEVVYASEINLWVFDGATGRVLLQEPNHASGTLWEYPLIADVDRDGHVEIVLASNNYAFSGWTGIAVLGDIRNNWVTGRPVWNQHAYHINNVDDDLGIPRREVANWIDGNNTFRQGGFGDGGALAAPDLVPVRIKTCPEDCPATARVLFQIENWGFNTVEPGLPWSIYGERDGVRTTLLTGYIEVAIAPGFSSDTQEAELAPDVESQYDRLILVADDYGDGSGQQNECEEDNNSLELPALCE